MHYIVNVANGLHRYDSKGQKVDVCCSNFRQQWCSALLLLIRRFDFLQSTVDTILKRRAKFVKRNYAKMTTTVIFFPFYECREVIFYGLMLLPFFSFLFLKHIIVVCFWNCKKKKKKEWFNFSESIHSCPLVNRYTAIDSWFNSSRSIHTFSPVNRYFQATNISCFDSWQRCSCVEV